ncbi:MAG: beta-propeller domain-containing protein [Syntrophomonadaceae bacterium]|nr:beta-propeller domain-containing protein [Syntrophomonadaceae bacterium]
MKKPVSLFFFAAVTLALVMFVASTSLLASDRHVSEVKIYLQGKHLDLEMRPALVNGRLLVPLRGVFEALGAQVNWNPTDRSITANRGSVTVKLTVNKKTALINGQSVPLDVAPSIINRRTMIPLRFISEALGELVIWEEETRSVYIKEKPSLPIVGTFENFQKLLAEAENQNSGLRTMKMLMPGTAAAPREALSSAPAPAASPDAAGAAAGSPGFSTTNIQVAGVDEADIVKTDGKYIYQVNNQRIVVAEAYPASNIRIVSMVNFTGENLMPQELYVDNRYLVVIGTSHSRSPVKPMPLIEPGTSPRIFPPPFFTRQTVSALIYDLKDKGNLKLVREVELEGNYVSSRKIGSSLYLVANRQVDFFRIMQNEQPVGQITPAYRDTAGKNDFVNIGLDQIRYFPGCVDQNFLLIAGLNLDRIREEVKVDAYLGAGQNIYASRNNLYVAITRHRFDPVMPQPLPADGPQRRLMPPITQASTTIYRFALHQGRADYSGKGEVPGIILNQFSMDEHNAHFRIATTTGDFWRTDEHTSKNNVYILDREMKITGRIEDIAPGEKIYSARFMGDRGYMVTFRTVDPFYVIDLKDPRAPKILGLLKIPGYSDYLHPFDENHIIGFGKETIEVVQKDRQGREIGTMAFDQGMKMAVFDVRDVANPVERFKAMIGDRGTHSELLQNHKALLFNKEKNLLAFPVTIMEVKKPWDIASGFPPHGEFTFQGALVYNINMETGFTLRGRITHLTAEDYQKAGRQWYSSDRNVERILYIGDNLYTLSKGTIKVHGFKDLKEINSLRIPR